MPVVDANVPEAHHYQCEDDATDDDCSNINPRLAAVDHSYRPILPQNRTRAQVQSGLANVRIGRVENLSNIPGFLFVDHVGIAVRRGELERQVAAYKLLGFAELHRQDVLGTDQVREVLLQIGDGPNSVQLLEPLDPASPVARQIERNGGRGGFAHLALRVADIHAAFSYMKEHGFRVLDEAPRAGSRGTKVFFVHPQTTEDTAFGYLIEVVQEAMAHA
jgi:methylmalonyl-CoA/ethylmalonyl-CoA epimerase